MAKGDELRLECRRHDCQNIDGTLLAVRGIENGLERNAALSRSVGQAI